MKRLLYLIHRWVGVSACLLMVVWLLSGLVMLFVGYPKLLPQERLQHLPRLDRPGCCVSVEQALAHSSAPAAVQQIRLTSIAGQPRYRLKEGDGRLRVVDAKTGQGLDTVDQATVLASARAFVPGADGHLLDRVDDDRWSHSGALNAHRPLHRVLMDDPAATLLYVSSTTGEVVMDVSRSEGLWNFVGAWLHWLYMFRDGSRDPFWSWLIIVLSTIGTVSAMTGALNGLWRWRFKGRYKTGLRTPYREFPMRWHHIMGLLFGGILFTWVFSGLMSMNPFGLFDPRHGEPNLVDYHQGAPGAQRPQLGVDQALEALRKAGFAACELEWKVLNGVPYLLARDVAGASRLILQHGQRPQVLHQWPEASLVSAGAHLFPLAPATPQVLHTYDHYYYARNETSMYGGTARPLPVLKLEFGDAGLTHVYLDPASGDMVHAVDATQRTERWLFNLLHSWDLPSLLWAETVRVAALILLSLGAMVIAFTGTLIAARRVRASLRRARQGAEWQEQGMR